MDTLNKVAFVRVITAGAGHGQVARERARVERKGGPVVRLKAQRAAHL